MLGMRGYAVAAAVSRSCLSVTVHVQASTIAFQHSGATDPTTEGWTLAQSDVSTVGPLVNDAGSGFDAWFASDVSSPLGGIALYAQVPTAGQNTEASTWGWTLRSRLRIPNADDAINNSGSVVMEYVNGITSFLIGFGSQADGDPVMVLWDGGFANGGQTATGSLFALEGGGSGYHLYELVFDPLAGSADLFIDGVERVSDYAGTARAINRVIFGAGSLFDTGQGNWSLVQFELVDPQQVVPEPSTVALLSLGLSGLPLFDRFRRRRGREAGGRPRP